ncbi:MAG: hypothetical protein FWD89_02180 [Firmicutes bacterium]|nr:hypothetical protein [Bacillota bacterium]
MKEKNIDDKISEALLTKALGYEASEEVFEYAYDENMGESLSKRKVTKKRMPPDISAAKAIFDMFEKKMNAEIMDMSDEELEEEKIKLEGEIYE